MQTQSATSKFVHITLSITGRINRFLEMMMLLLLLLLQLLHVRDNLLCYCGAETMEKLWLAVTVDLFMINNGRWLWFGFDGGKSDGFMSLRFFSLSLHEMNFT